MRSLAAKLTLALLFVGLTGTLLVALFADRLVQREFNRFVGDRDFQAVTTALTDFYGEQGSWDGVGRIMRTGSPLMFNSTRLIVVDPAGLVVFDIDTSNIGAHYLPGSDDVVLPLANDGQTIGAAYILPPIARPESQGERLPPEALFRRNARIATIFSALIAAVISLTLGVALARPLVRPVRELTVATQAVADGEFGQQVQVRSHDEFGELATSFNRMSADLAQARQARQQMTADIAHDLRTPLTILRGYTEGLKGGELVGNDALYRIMYDEVLHLQHLVDDLRTLSLADTRALTLNRRPVDPRALLERTGLASIHQAQQQGVDLRIDAADDLPSILVDTERMTQALNNLTNNALHHTTCGQVVLGAQRAGSQVVLSVGDTGEGINEEDLPHIFDRFYRADSSRHGRGDGSTGLGLAIVKAIVEAHGGTISVASVRGQGTNFSVVLPGHAEPAGQQDSG